MDEAQGSALRRVWRSLWSARFCDLSVGCAAGWPLTSASDQRLTTSHLGRHPEHGTGMARRRRGSGRGVTHGRLPHHRERQRWQIEGVAASGRVPHLPQTRRSCEGVGTLRFPAGCPGVCGPNPSTGLDEQVRYCDAVEPRQERGVKKLLILSRGMFSRPSPSGPHEQWRCVAVRRASRRARRRRPSRSHFAFRAGS